MPTIDLSWILGIAIMFGLSLLMTRLTFNDIESFFIFLTIFCGFVVWAGLLPIWILILTLIILVLIFGSRVKKGELSK